jgi:2-C-methyl-D-erythritol 2,4-cyclodiphosphate synthase
MKDVRAVREYSTNHGTQWLRYSVVMAAPPIIPFRIGHGYDLHRLEPRPPMGKGRLFILGGVTFPDHTAGPVSHSDGDAVYHAVTDAILGAIGQPDIGQLFPDDDPRHESADSAIFLREAAKRMLDGGWVLGNLDITVICERPKLSPHKRTMIENLAHHLGFDVAQVNLKGKTHEKVDAVGEGRAVEVHVVALLARRA